MLALILFLGGDQEETAVDMPAPVPPPPAPVAPAPPAGPVAAAASPEGLRLHGVAGAGAIIGLPDGGQRLIAIGRDVVPGLALASVGVDHAVLRSSTASYRLGFDGVASGPAAAPAAPARDVAGLREETLRNRLSLAPVSENGRVVGHQLRAGAQVPALARAGLRSGDVIRSVNGAQFTAEQLEELAWTMANSSEVTFDIERQGRPLRLALSR